MVNVFSKFSNAVNLTDGLDGLAIVPARAVSCAVRRPGQAFGYYPLTVLRICAIVGLVRWYSGVPGQLAIIWSIASAVCAIYAEIRPQAI